MSDRLTLRQFNLSPNHPWADTVAQLILCDIYGWGKNLKPDVWADDEARADLGIADGQSTQHWGLVDNAVQELRAVAILDEQYLKDEQAMYLDSLVVAQKYRRLGLGSEMLTHMESQAKGFGAFTMRLYGLERTREFYHARGYEYVKQNEGDMEKYLYNI